MKRVLFSDLCRHHADVDHGLFQVEKKHYYRSAYLKATRAVAAVPCGARRRGPAFTIASFPDLRARSFPHPRKPAHIHFDDAYGAVLIRPSRLTRSADISELPIPDSKFQIPNGCSTTSAALEFESEPRFDSASRNSLCSGPESQSGLQNSDAATASPSSSATSRSCDREWVSVASLVGQPEAHTPGSQGPESSSEDRRRGA